jgi:hypothetical protein
MVQRSATCVISSRTADAAIFSTAFAESRAIEDADFANHSMPYRLAMRFAAGGGTARLKAMDKDMHDGLREKGFQLTWEVEPGKGEVGLIGFFFEKVSSGTRKCQAIMERDYRSEHLLPQSSTSVVRSRLSTARSKSRAALRSTISKINTLCLLMVHESRPMSLFLRTSASSIRRQMLMPHL